jgi:hypothetical protein
VLKWSIIRKKNRRGDRKVEFRKADSGIMVPVEKPEPEPEPEPEWESISDIRQYMRMKAGFPKIIKLWNGDKEFRLYIINDEIYTNLPLADIHYELVDRQEIDGEWYRIEQEEPC